MPPWSRFVPRYDVLVISDDEDEDDAAQEEEVERRHALRGAYPGLHIALLAPREAAFENVEASRRGFFVRVADPEVYRLAEVFDADVVVRGQVVTCKLEVVRKELVPRVGIALRVAHIDPTADERLRAMLGPLGE
jgi:hypothetical protein